MATRGKSNRWRQLRWLLLAIVLAAGAGGWWWQVSQAAKPSPTISAPVTQGDIDVSVEASGKVQAARSVDVPSQSSGQVREVLVQQGQTVTVGQPLAVLDDSTLRLAVQQDEAALASAQASLTQTMAGPSAKELTDAEANLQVAQAKLDKTKAGSYTATDIAKAQATLDAAQAKLKQLQAGPTKETKQAAQAKLDAAKLKLAQAQVSTYSASDVAEAKAALDSAKLKLARVQAGATDAERSAAQLKVSEAQAALESTTSEQAATVQARLLERDKADNAVREAQDNLTSVYQQTHDASGKLRSDPGDQPGYFERLYAAAVRKEQDAEADQRKAADAYNDALVQQKNALAKAEAALADAKQQLADTLNPTNYQSDLAAAQANLAAAQATYDKTTKPRDAADIQQAEYDLQQAQAAYDQAIAPTTASELADAEAAVTKARADLATAQQQPLASDITQSQAEVDKAQAALTELKGKPTAEDIAKARADVAKAEAQLATDQRKLSQTTITAPINGSVAQVKVVPGDTLDSGKVTVTLIDTATMHLAIDLSESDVAKVKPNQAVSISLDALPDAVLTGTVASVAPTGSSSNNVVSYAVNINFAPGNNAVKVGMSASVSIIVEHHAAVIQVPSAAIKQQGALKSVSVLYGAAQSPVEVAVQTGATDGAVTEIISCLQLGKQCLKVGDKVAIDVQQSTSSNNSPDKGGNMEFSVGPVGAPGAGPVIVHRSAP